MRGPAGLQQVLERLTLAREELVGAAFFAVAAAALAAPQVLYGIPLIWPANAIAAAALIRLPRVNVARAALALLVGGLLAYHVAGDTAWTIALMMTCVHMTEIAAIVLVYGRITRFPYPDISILQASHMTVGIGVLLSGMGALLAGLALHRVSGTSLWPLTQHWWGATALGACLFTPPLVLYSAARWRAMTAPRFLLSNLLTGVACLIGTYLAIRFVRFPFVVMGLLLMMAAFRVGALGASIFGLCCGVMVMAMWMQGLHPMGLVRAEQLVPLAELPIVAIVAAVMPPIAVGLGTEMRRQSARAMLASERRYRESMEHSPVGMAILDLNGAWAFTNTALQKMLGYTQAQFASLAIDSLTHPADAGEMHRRWQRLLSLEVESYTVTRRMLHRCGEWVWVHGAVSLTRGADGKPLHFIAHIESLEERRKAEGQLAAERELLQTTLAAIGEAVITADAKGSITYLNDAACELLGQPLEQVYGRQMQDVLTLNELDGSRAAEDLVARCLAERTLLRQEEPCALVRADGISYVSETVSPVFTPKRELSGIVVVLQNANASIARTRNLRHQAHHDPLTDLLNRAGFDIQVQQAFDRARLDGTPAALIALDLDHFKAVNDAAGHPAGDAVLRRVAETLRSLVRPSDTIARLGGDEFALLLHDCPQALSQEVAQRVLRALNPLRTSWQGAAYQTGASLGLAHTGHGLATAAEWLAEADRAAYASKRAGRGVLSIFGEHGAKAGRPRLRLAT